jgi:hypothetical protein
MSSETFTDQSVNVGSDKYYYGLNQGHLNDIIMSIEKLRKIVYGNSDHNDIKDERYKPSYEIYDFDDLLNFLKIYRLLTPYLDEKYKQLLSI